MNKETFLLLMLFLQGNKAIMTFYFITVVRYKKAMVPALPLAYVVCQPKCMDGDSDENMCCL